MRTAKRAAKRRVRSLIASRQPRRTDLPHHLWDLAVGPSGHLSRAGVDFTDLVAEFGSPLHVVDGAALDRNAARALSASAGPAPVDVFYSYKTNPVPGVLTRLHAAGIGAEVISAYELWLARSLGVPPERIIYNGPAKSYESVCEAIDAEILLTNANSEGDYHQLVEAARHVGKVASAGVRVALPGMWAGQFGIAGRSKVLDAVIRDARAEPAVDLVGLHLHRGITIRSRTELVDYVTAALAFVDELEQRTGWAPKILDLGGSLSTPTVGAISRRDFRLNRALATDIPAPDPLASVEIGDAVALVAETVAGHFAGRTAPRVVLEPGRGLTGNTQLLLASVLDVKRDGVVVHAVLDAGINIAQTVQGAYHQVFSVTAPTAAPVESYRLVGPICTPADVLYNNWRLPDLAPGHVLAIMDSGAYFVPFSTSFSFPQPAVVMQDGPEIGVVRERESFEDIVRNDVWPALRPPS